MYGDVYGELPEKKQRLTFDEGIGNTSWQQLLAGEELRENSVTTGQIVENAPPAPKVTTGDSYPIDSDEQMTKATEIYDGVVKDELEKEKSKNRELLARLTEKEKQLKISERQSENMKRHMTISQSVSLQQQEEIKSLRNEINRLTVFRSTVRNYQNNSTHGDHEHEVNPADMLAVSYNE